VDLEVRIEGAYTFMGLTEILHVFIKDKYFVGKKEVPKAQKASDRAKILALFSAGLSPSGVKFQLPSACRSILDHAHR